MLKGIAHCTNGVGIYEWNLGAYASKLNASGVPLDAIREQLGHANLSTTLSYLYNPLTEKETYSLIADAL